MLKNKFRNLDEKFRPIIETMRNNYYAGRRDCFGISCSLCPFGTIEGSDEHVRCETLDKRGRAIIIYLNKYIRCLDEMKKEL